MKKYIAICFFFLFNNEIISGLAILALMVCGMHDFLQALARELRERDREQY